MWHVHRRDNMHYRSVIVRSGRHVERHFEGVIPRSRARRPWNVGIYTERNQGLKLRAAAMLIVRISVCECSAAVSVSVSSPREAN